VTEEGIIAEIREAQAEEAPAEETAPEMAMEEAPAAPQAKKIVESIVKESFFAEIEQLKADNIALKAELEALKQPKVEEVVELSVEPITYNPENEQKVEPFRYSNKKEMSAIDRVMAKLS
jgi:hypothetical protein